MIKSIGYVYVIARDDGFCKIGASSNPEKRILSVCNSNGIPVKRNFVSVRLKNHYDFERMIHKLFSRYKNRNEWFLVGFDNVVASIKRYQSEITVIEINEW